MTLSLFAEGISAPGGLPSPARLTFSGHQTFPFRFAWPPKGVRGLARDEALFSREDAVVSLGVGKNMVESIRFWCQALGLIEVDGRRGVGAPTELGASLLLDGGWDPFLEDQATLWLLHWQLVDNQEIASTWSLAFTSWARDVFTRDELVSWLLRVAHQNGIKKVSPVSLRRDVDVFMRTYLPSSIDRRRALEDTFDCPLVSLGLIRDIGDGFYQFGVGPKPSLPIEIFGYALACFWNHKATSQESMSFERLMYDAGSPGAAFKLSDRDLTAMLERLPRWTGFRYDETGGLRTLLRIDAKQSKQPRVFLERYYGNPPVGGA